jgi:hypothetical protein
MGDFFSELLKAQPDTLLVVAGVVLLLIAVVGNIAGKIEPGKQGRIAAGLIGATLIGVGLWMHSQHSSAPVSGPASSADSTNISKSNPDSTAGSAPKLLSYFGGSWKNTDPETRGITTIQIRLDGDHAFVHTWGRCHPADCDWGETNAVLFAPDVSSHAVQTVSAVYTTNFSETRLVLRPGSGQTLQADISTHFTDNSGRSDYAASDSFRRE